MNVKVDIYGDKELVFYLDNISSNMRRSLIDGLNDVGKHLWSETRNKFGSYQRGWPKLKMATVLYKQRRMASLSPSKRAAMSSFLPQIAKALSGDMPLIFDGDLYNSIKYEVSRPTLSTTVYSDNEYAAVHEYGHGNIPARSFLRLTLWDEERVVFQILSDKVGSLLQRRI